MGLKKGQPSQAFLEGKMEKYNFKNLTPEQRKEYARKSAETRRENARKRREMKAQLEMLLTLDVRSPQLKKQMKEMGLTKKDMDNQMMLMVSLLKKGFSGDTGATKLITEIMNGEAVNPAAVQAPVINIIGVKSEHKKDKDAEDADEEEWFEDEEEW